MKAVKSIVVFSAVIFFLTGCSTADRLARLIKPETKAAVREDIQGDAAGGSGADTQILGDKASENVQNPQGNSLKTGQTSQNNQQTAGQGNTKPQSSSTLKELKSAPVDASVSSPDEYINAVHQAIKAGKAKFSVRVNHFDAGKYNDEPAKSGGEYNTRFSGYSYNGSYIGKDAVLAFEFSYFTAEQLGGENMLPDVNAININSYDNYCSEVKKALNEFKTKLTFRVYNYNDSYSLEVVNKYWKEEPLRYSTGISTTSNVISNGGTGKILVININYTDINGASIEAAVMAGWRSAAESRAQAIVNEIIKQGMTDLQREKALHDYIVKNASYSDQGTKSHTDYGVLTEGKGVCESYAKAMYRLLTLVGIPCKLVDGTAGGEAHQWNQVQIGGVWYHLDATWNDPVGAPAGYISHKYFNLTDEQMRKDHSW